MPAQRRGQGFEQGGPFDPGHVACQAEAPGARIDGGGYADRSVTDVVARQARMAAQAVGDSGDLGDQGVRSTPGAGLGVLGQQRAAHVANRAGNLGSADVKPHGQGCIGPQRI